MVSAQYTKLRVLKFISLFFFCFLSYTTITAQISYGGKPLPLNAGFGMRAVSPSGNFFIEMPAFNEKEAMLRSQQEASRLKSLEFAHKFHVFLRPDNSGTSFSYGNINVWRVGIRSKGAYSLNILFSKFRLPQGAQVFVYNADQTEILGSYTHQNNSDLNILPVQPVSGEEIIVEYQEPINAEFKGEIEIGEVNHDFLGLFRATEPRDPEQDCHPNLVCYPEDIEPGSGVVALIINGTAYCTGSLVNNSAEDGTPYLLTATHCLNNNFNAGFLLNRKYDLMAGTIVAFFNYHSPVCDSDIRGPLQMTMASADSVLISERHDISLLKLNQMPPEEYQPIYLGWNASSSPQSPFHGIHHPNGGIKKVAVFNKSLKITTAKFGNVNYEFEPNAHWSVGPSWDVGATEYGSSGSPLLDNDKRVVGTLSGGGTYCSNSQGPDIYASLAKFWNVTQSLENPNPISYYLDPTDSKFLQINAYNPYRNTPIVRNHNFKTTEKAVQTYHNSVPLFSTNNPLGYSEFAEEFSAASETELEGIFISSPAVNGITGMNIRVRVYLGDENGPRVLIHDQPYTYSYRYYSASSFNYALRDMRRNVENYIELDRPVKVSGKFYISYAETNGISSGFAALNTEPRKTGSGITSTAWMKNAAGWVRSSENIDFPINTSLLISTYVIGNTSVIVDPKEEEAEIKAFHSREAQRIFIESNKDLIEWEIFYSSGRKIHHGSTENSINRTSYSTVHLIPGVYIVKVKTLGGAQKAIKVLVR